MQQLQKEYTIDAPYSQATRRMERGISSCEQEMQKLKVKKRGVEEQRMSKNGSERVTKHRQRDRQRQTRQTE